MLCFRDKTFCASDCTASDCHRFVSEQVRLEAREWWSHDPDNAPIAVSDFSESCTAYTPPEEAKT